jgi:ABC-type uncharacterized transport system fused permease/ATPase subunit
VLLFRLPHNKTASLKDIPCNIRNNSKDRRTVLLACNAEGTDQPPLFLTRKMKCLGALKISAHKICSQQKSMIIKKNCLFFCIIIITIIIIITTITYTTTMAWIRWRKVWVSQAIFIGYLRASHAQMDSQNNDYTMILLSEDPCGAHP